MAGGEPGRRALLRAECSGVWSRLRISAGWGRVSSRDLPVLRRTRTPAAGGPARLPRHRLASGRPWRPAAVTGRCPSADARQERPPADAQLVVVGRAGNHLRQPLRTSIRRSGCGRNLLEVLGAEGLLLTGIGASAGRCRADGEQEARLADTKCSPGASVPTRCTVAAKEERIGSRRAVASRRAARRPSEARHAPRDMGVPGNAHCPPVRE